MPLEPAYCTVCRARIKPGALMVFSEAARPRHVECPPAVCPVCRNPVLSGDRIVLEGDWLLHSACDRRRLQRRD